MIETRILPREEWSRLDMVPMPQIAPHVSPNEVYVVGVEEDGELRACVTLYRATHWEGTWIDPDHRKPGITRALIEGAFNAVEDLQSSWAFVKVDEEPLAKMLRKLGARHIDVETYVLPVGGASWQRQ